MPAQLRAAFPGGIRRCAAPCASSATWNWSPASGTPCNPSTSTGVEGPAFLIGWPRSSNIARTLPYTAPTMKTSPTLQRSVLHQHGGDRAAAFVHARFEHRAAARSVRIGLQFAQIGDEQNHFEQLAEDSSWSSRRLPPSRCRRPIPRASGRDRRAGASRVRAAHPACRSC